MARVRSCAFDRGYDWHSSPFSSWQCSLPACSRMRSPKFTVRTLADIEHGVLKASPGTYAMLENKLAWAPRRIDTILAGGEPKELVVKLRANPNALSHASTEELLMELRRRIIAPRDRRHETCDDWGVCWCSFFGVPAVVVRPRSRSLSIGRGTVDVGGGGRRNQRVRDLVAMKSCVQRSPAKGVIERAHNYSERSFLPRRSFASPADFNTQLADWLALANTAPSECWGCTPPDRIGADRAAMLALPPVSPDPGIVKTQCSNLTTVGTRRFTTYVEVVTFCNRQGYVN
jgi:hypothetical protein